MKHIENSWKIKNNFNIYFQVWEPEDSIVRAAVCLVHGLGEHTGRYEHVAQHLTESGYALLGFDLRGHGKSDGIRGHIDSVEDFLEDIDTSLEIAKERYPEKPRFLYGHSLGGLLVLNYGLKRQPNFAGVVATGPALHSSLEDQSFKLNMANILGTFFPKLKLRSGLIPNDLCHDPKVLQRYEQDPLVHDWGSLKMAKELQKTIKWTREHAAEFQPPLLLMNGTSDQIVYPSSCEEFGSAVHGDCTVKLWDGLYHEIHNEPEKDQVMDEIVAWLDCRSGSPLDNISGS